MKTETEETLKRHLISAAVTFVSIFLLTLGTQVADAGEASITASLIFGAVATAARAGLKAVFEALVPVKGA